MPMLPGNAQANTGLAGRIRTKLDAKLGGDILSMQQLLLLADAVSEGVVDELKANASLEGAGEMLGFQTDVPDPTDDAVSQAGGPLVPFTAGGGSGSPGPTIEVVVNPNGFAPGRIGRFNLVIVVETFADTLKTITIGILLGAGNEELTLIQVDPAGSRTISISGTIIFKGAGVGRVQLTAVTDGGSRSMVPSADVAGTLEGDGTLKIKVGAYWEAGTSGNSCTCHSLEVMSYKVGGGSIA